MKNLLKLILVFVLVLNSCSKDNNDIISTEAQTDKQELKDNLLNYSKLFSTSNQVSNYTNTSNNDDYWWSNDCFSVDFPVTVVSLDLNELTVNSDEELHEAFNSVDEFYYDFVYPITASSPDGALVITFNSSAQLASSQISCSDDAPDIPGTDPDFPDTNPEIPGLFCFNFNFPVTLIGCDDEPLVVNSDAELLGSCFLDVVFPISITLEDGSVETINNSSEFDSVYNECLGIDHCVDCDPICFEIVFPVTLATSTGEIITVQNSAEFIGLLDLNLSVNYPINVVLNDGSTVTVNDDAEFNALFDSCI